MLACIPGVAEGFQPSDHIHRKSCPAGGLDTLRPGRGPYRAARGRSSRRTTAVRSAAAPAAVRLHDVLDVRRPAHVLRQPQILAAESIARIVPKVAALELLVRAHCVARQHAKEAGGHMARRCAAAGQDCRGWLRARKAGAQRTPGRSVEYRVAARVQLKRGHATSVAVCRASTLAAARSLSS
eukprot:923537-Prymnesium_polylepis.1